ncbi:MAG: ferredoxin--NADP reductase [Saprospiraceae bacterium]|nr:ferredoxin--NADP reductase [Saprospiraceae bacterium]
MITFSIKEKIQETARAATLILEPLNGPLEYHAGQFLTFLFDDLGVLSFRRSYSLSSAPGIDAFPAITVKRTINGRASRYLVEEAGAGDLLHAIEPAGQFVLKPASGARDIFLIGGGSGITPLYSLLKWALAQEPQSNIVLIHADHSSQSIIFREAIGKLARQYPTQFRCIYLLSRSDDDVYESIFPPASWLPGRLSNALVEDLVQRYQKHPPALSQFFLCGPEGLMLKSSQALGFMGYTPEQVHREFFVVKPPAIPPAKLFPDSQVKIRYKGKLYEVDVPAGQTILESAENQGIRLPYSCRSGICTTCSGQCLSGEVEMYTQLGLMNTNTTKGLVMTCTGYPLTKSVEISLDKDPA